MWRRRVGEWWWAAAEIAQIFACRTVILSTSSLHILLVIHIRHNGSPTIAYGQTACCQSMRLTPQLTVRQAMTNSSAVACLFCWPSLNSSPSSRDPSRCPYHALSKRTRQSHPAIPQAATTTRPSPPYPAQAPPHTRRENPLFTSRVTRRIPLDQHKQWQRHSWPSQPQTQARQSGYARCLCPDGSAAVHVMRSSHHCRPRQYPL